MPKKSVFVIKRLGFQKRLRGHVSCCFTIAHRTYCAFISILDGCRSCRQERNGHVEYLQAQKSEVATRLSKYVQYVLSAALATTHGLSFLGFLNWGESLYGEDRGESVCIHKLSEREGLAKTLDSEIPPKISLWSSLRVLVQRTWYCGQVLL